MWLDSILLFPQPYLRTTSNSWRMCLASIWVAQWVTPPASSIFIVELKNDLSFDFINIQHNIQRYFMDYDYLSASLRVTVPSFKSDSSAVFFCIQLQSNDNKWYVDKRFSQFDNLLKELKNYHSLPSLPSKSFFKMNDKQLQSRRKGLQAFLQKIVVRKDLMNSDPVKSFLQLDKNASEMMVNPPKLSMEYLIEGQTKGIRDFYYHEEERIFYIVTSDMNTVSRFKSNVKNTNLPWENQSSGKTVMEIGSVQAWSSGESNKFMKLWSKGYPKEALCIHFDKASNRVLVGLQDGVIDIINVKNDGYEDVVCVKAHQAKVVGLAFDALSNVAYSVSQDKSFRVSHGTSLAQVVSVPHKQAIYSMLRDTLNKRIFFGTKNGEVYIYDISQAEKPKLMNVLNNNKKGSIRSIFIDTNRNYFFTGSYDDGELNVFDMDKPGRQKYAKMIATLKGKQKVRTMTWAPKRSQIITGYSDGSITFWDAIEGKSIYVLKAFDTDVTRLEYIEQIETIISTSKAKSIKFWRLPKEWRDAKLVADEQKVIQKRVLQQNKDRVEEAIRKAGEDSDDDDLAGWHLD